jgi:hypothetical protein
MASERVQSMMDDERLKKRDIPFSKLGKSRADELRQVTETLVSAGLIISRADKI